MNADEYLIILVGDGSYTHFWKTTNGVFRAGNRNKGYWFLKGY